MSQDEYEILKWDLFRGMVCRSIEDKGLTPFLDCEVWEFASSLDMSYEELKNRPLPEWQPQIDTDILEYSEYLSKQHFLPNDTRRRAGIIISSKTNEDLEMKIVSQTNFDVAQYAAKLAVELHRNKQYGDFDWAVAMLALKEAYGLQEVKNGNKAG